MFVLPDRTFLLTMYKRYAAKNEISMVKMFEESLSKKSMKSEPEDGKYFINGFVFVKKFCKK